MVYDSQMKYQTLKIDEIKSFKSGCEMVINNSLAFNNLGTLQSHEDSMLTYCTEPHFFEIARHKHNVVATFIKKEDVPLDSEISFIFSDNPMLDFFLFHTYLVENTDFYGIDEPTQIASSANIHPRAYIAEKNVKISEKVTVCANAVIMENTVIKPGVYVGPGTIVGIDGSQTINYGEKKNFRIPHAGGVCIDENTFIGANSVIVKSIFREFTYVGENVTIGNLVNIGHNCKIGDDVMILANAALCGSTIVMQGARISPGAVVSNGKIIGKDSWVTIGAVVTKDVEKGQRVSGNFAIDHRKLLKTISKMNK